MGFDLWDGLLRALGQDEPCLVLDRDRFLRNLKLARHRTQDGVRIRVVAKSLACLPMLDLALDHLDAIGLMTFSASMLETLLQQRPEVEHLLGKPLPVTAAARVLTQCATAQTQVIWLIDTSERAAQYAAMAQAQGCTLRVALELDVGLHRGGVEPQKLAALVADVAKLDGLRLEGIMGYEPHLAKLPPPLQKRATRMVEAALQVASEVMRQVVPTTPLVNTGGSLTFANYNADLGVTEVSLGSVLLQPQDFVLPVTKGFEPALFIATPILKYRANNPVPGLEMLSALTKWRRRANLSIYGGYWKAVPVHPRGFGYSGVFGRSSNQEVWAGPQLANSPVDHFAFLHPTQSEAVIPEISKILVLSDDEICGIWTALPPGQ